MGYDAYNLASRLYSSEETLQQAYAGATGRLYLDSDGRIHRRLAWAQFVRGEMVPLPDTDVPVETLDDDSLGGQEYSEQPTEWPNPQLRQGCKSRRALPEQ